MHEYLKETIDRFKLKFCEDNRIIAMYLYGSGGKDLDDEYSDVDLEIIIRDKYYTEVENELKEVCESVCGKIHLWFPEGKRDDYCNYAFLFEAGGNQFLYDFTIITESRFKQNSGFRKQLVKIIFDKEGLLDSGDGNVTDSRLKVDNIKWKIEQYWIYFYLNGKYYKRQDIYKLLYIQNFLFNSHIKLLNTIYPEETWVWWPSDIKKLPEAKRLELLVYFGSKTCNQIAEAIEKEIQVFADDARQACEIYDISYPQELEEYVKKHLRIMGVLPRR